MSERRSDALSQLVEELCRLPGIGEKTATRLAFHLLTRAPEQARSLAEALVAVVEKVRPCSVCCNLSERDPCRFCADGSRDASCVCVVETVSDLKAIDATGAHPGLYHVLHGHLSPLEGIGPEDIRISELRARLEAGGIAELILATNPTAEGEATAGYLRELAAPYGIRLSRIATGVPLGGDVEYIDRMTLASALDHRRPID